MSLPDIVHLQKVIAIARGLDGESAVALAGALAQAGLSVIEVTMERGHAADAIEVLRGSDVTVGAGTVMSVAQAEQAVAAGAEFLVSPHLDPALAAFAAAGGVPYLPGVFSPGEAAAAIALGLRTVKLFPASVLGPRMIGALQGPFPDLDLIPTGGIDAGNAADFIEAGAVAVGVGGWLTGPGDSATITARARELRDVVV